VTTVNPRRLREEAPVLSVGMLGADLLDLGTQLSALDEAQIELVHIDVMDGVFCPQMTVGPPIVRAIPDRFVKDVHLMIHEPLGKIETYVNAGAGIITIHVESTHHPHGVLRSLAGTGVIRGLALNPGTTLATVEPLLDEIDLLLLLAVNPGFSGGSFTPSTARRVAQARTLLQGREIVLAVDGGVTAANIADIAALGPDVIVAGSAVYDGSDDPGRNASILLGKARAARVNTAEGLSLVPAHPSLS
jgi:ribulose-phosphate 3-epimerase